MSDQSSIPTRIYEEDYILERLDSQQKYFSKKSALNQKRYKQLKIAVVGMAVLIPMLSGLIPKCTEGLHFVHLSTGILGVLITFFEVLLTINQYHDNWIEFRATSEMLKREKMFFLTRTGYYGTKDDSGLLQTLVERIENILHAENGTWKERRKQAEEGSDS